MAKTAFGSGAYAFPAMKSYIENSRNRLDSTSGPASAPLDPNNDDKPDSGGTIDPSTDYVRFNRQT